MIKTADKEKILIEIESRGFILLNEYINNKIKLELLCSNGHYWDVLIGNFRKRDCPTCKGTNDIKYAYYFVKQTIEDCGYTLVSEKYKDVYTKLNTVCPNGHEYRVNFKDFKHGNRCRKCPRKPNYNQLDLQFVRDQIEQSGYTLLSDIYTKAKEQLDILCSNGHKFHMSWDKFRMGRRCLTCHIENTSGENHWNWNGGSTPENARLRNTNQGRQWIKEVFKRDNYTCQCCLKRGSNLNAHHIENFSKNPDLRFELNNGITLCEYCHLQTYGDSFHARYTQFNNTKKQLIEYITDRRIELGISGKMHLLLH